MKINKNKQGTPEWLKDRELMLSASHGQEIGNAGKGLETYCKKLVMEFLYPKTIEHFTNPDMDRGNELEPVARFLYEIEKGCKVEEVGFCYESGYGASPDGLVGEDGLIEIKCRNNKIFYDYKLSMKIPSKDDWQMQMQMLVLNRKWCDYVCYNPNFNDDGLIIQRVYADKEKQEKLRHGIKAGLEIIKKLKGENNEI